MDDVDFGLHSLSRNVCLLGRLGHFISALYSLPLLSCPLVGRFQIYAEGVPPDRELHCVSVRCINTPVCGRAYKRTSLEYVCMHQLTTTHELMSKLSSYKR